MSKRYTFTRPYKDAYEIVDRDIAKALNPEDVADLLNQQQERIAELEKQLKNKQEEVVKSLQEYLTEHDKQLVDKIKRHFDNNFYFDISGQMCVSMEELDEFLGQLKGENK